MRTEVVKTEVLRLLHEVPFRPFVITLENRQRIEVGHAENIAFDPEPNGAADFYAFSGPTRVFSTFEAVTNVALLDSARPNGDGQGAPAWGDSKCSRPLPINHINHLP